MKTVTPLLLFAWFVVPWLVFMYRVVTVTIYESRLGLFNGLGPFQFGDLFRRIAARREIDSEYDKMRLRVMRSLKITVVWWGASFAVMACFALVCIFFVQA
jgi:hypothetical protein